MGLKNINDLNLTTSLTEISLTPKTRNFGEIMFNKKESKIIQGPSATIPTRPTASSIRSSSGRAMELTATLRCGSVIAKCVQGASLAQLETNVFFFSTFRMHSL